MIMPFAIVGALFMLFNKVVFNMNWVIFVLLIIFVYISSMYIRFKYFIYAHFRTLNKEIEEIENMERDYGKNFFETQSIESHPESHLRVALYRMSTFNRDKIKESKPNIVLI